MRTEIIKNKPVVTRLARYPFTVTILCDVDDAGYGIRFEWVENGGEAKEYTCFLDEVLGTKCQAFDDLSKIAKGGFSSIKDLKAFVNDAIDASDSGEVKTERSTTKAGWRDGSYVANGFSLGDAPRLMASRGVIWSKAGNESAYMSKVAELLEKNPAVAFMCGFFVAGSLVKLVGGENFILSLVGRTSVGKTLAIRTALAMRGDPAGFATFDSTQGALKSLLRQAGDSCLPIDEIGQSGMTPEQKQKLIYDVSQGKERGRLRKNGNDYVASDSERLHYTVILTGEESIMSANAAGGATVRVTELIFDGDRSKLWSTIKTPAQAEELETFWRENHGFLLPKIIEKIAQDKGAIVELYGNILATMRAVAENKFALDSAGLRKLKTLALAVTGATIIEQIVGGEIGVCGAADGFAMEQINNGVATVATNDGDKYLEFLRSIPARYQERLYQINGGELLDANVKNAVGATWVKSDVIELRMLTTEFDKLCAKDGIDSKRLIEFCDHRGYARSIKNGGANRTMSKRLQVGPVKAACYQFIIPVGEADDAEE